jgi:hypothetical protein
MRDLPPSRDLLALARRLLLQKIAPLVPPERRRDVHLAATAIAIALRESAAGDRPAAEIDQLLFGFYAKDRPHLDPLPACREREGPAAKPCEGEGREVPVDLLARLAADLRRGAFETTGSRERAARAILWRLTLLKLREGNPGFLAANGFR